MYDVMDKFIKTGTALDKKTNELIRVESLTSTIIDKLREDVAAVQQDVNRLGDDFIVMEQRHCAQ